MKDSINLWFIDNDNHKRVPQVFSKVLLNFMLGRYPICVFEKFSINRLEYIFEELLTKITAKNFFSVMRPIWWPQSIEFVPIPVLRQKIKKNTLTWILHLQELLLSAREFYAEQIYLSRKSYKHFPIIKINESKDKSKKSKRKAQSFIKISPSIFKPIRNENSYSNVPVLKTTKSISYPHILTVTKPFGQQLDGVLKKEAIEKLKKDIECGGASQRSYVQLENLLKGTIEFPASPNISQCLGVGWKPFVYLDNILKKQTADITTDVKSYVNTNCRVKLCDILKPIVVVPIEKTTYMNSLGLIATSTLPRQKKEEIPRIVKYKKYCSKVPFSSIGGQMIIESLQHRYHYNPNLERIGRRLYINEPLRQKNQNKAPSNKDTILFIRKIKTRSYHAYKFYRRLPLNIFVLPKKIQKQYCRTTAVNVKRLDSDILKLYMKDCKVILSRIAPKETSDRNAPNCRIA